jgi:hypothetical protein
MYKYVKQSRVGHAKNPLQKSLCYHIQPFNKLILRDRNTCVNENYFPVRLQKVSGTGFKLPLAPASNYLRHRLHNVSSTGFEISPAPASKPSPGKLFTY